MDAKLDFLRWFSSWKNIIVHTLLEIIEKKKLASALSFYRHWSEHKHNRPITIVALGTLIRALRTIMVVQPIQCNFASEPSWGVVTSVQEGQHSGSGWASHNTNLIRSIMLSVELRFNLSTQSPLKQTWDKGNTWTRSTPLAIAQGIAVSTQRQRHRFASHSDRQVGDKTPNSLCTLSAEPARN